MTSMRLTARKNDAGGRRRRNDLRVLRGPQHTGMAKVEAPAWEYPEQGEGNDKLDFSNLLVPTMDSVRGQYILNQYHQQKYAALLVGALKQQKLAPLRCTLSTDASSMLIKAINFSSATKARNCQDAIELSWTNVGENHLVRQTV